MGARGKKREPRANAMPLSMKFAVISTLFTVKPDVTQNSTKKTVRDRTQNPKKKKKKMGETEPDREVLVDRMPRPKIPRASRSIRRARLPGPKVCKTRAARASQKCTKNAGDASQVCSAQTPHTPCCLKYTPRNCLRVCGTGGGSC